MPALFGKGQNELLKRLRDQWLPQGPLILLLEGFPGVGKTELADQLISQIQCKSVYLEVPEPHFDATVDPLAHLAEKLGEIGFPEMADADQEQGAKLTALGKILQNQILIVIDEFQNTYVGRTRKPSESFSKFVEGISRQQTLPGRMLLLSNRSIEPGRWSAKIQEIVFPELNAVEAELLLVQLLDDLKQSENIPPERRLGIVESLGRNPRALTTLVHCLADEPLDELMPDDRQTPEVQDRAISAKLAEQLETEILKRAMRHLEHESQVFLRRLCAHRLPVRKQALEFMVMPGSDSLKLTSDLTQRFMLSVKNQYYHIHPIVRAIAGERWTADSREMVQAHSTAADFYERPFIAKQFVLSGRTGGQFAELRYHLTKAGRPADLTQYRTRVLAEVSQYWSDGSEIPKDALERDNYITLLSSALLSPGPDKLEIYLARLLRNRGRPRDLELALTHVERTTCQNPAWALLRVLLERAVRGPHAAIKTALNFLSQVGPYGPIYLHCAEMENEVGLADEAIDLLKRAIAIVPPGDLASLYHSYAEILSQLGRTQEASMLLREGLTKVPNDMNAAVLYIAYGYVSASYRPQAEVISTLVTGISQVPTENEAGGIVEALLYYAAASADTLILADIQAAVGTRFVADPMKILADVLLLQVQRQWDQAARQATAGLQRFPRYLPLRLQAALSRMCQNDFTEADRILCDVYIENENATGDAIVWLRAMIADAGGKTDLASRYAAVFVGRALAAKDGSVEILLMGYWSNRINRLGIPNFPVFEEARALLEKQSAGAQIQSEDPDFPSHRSPEVDKAVPEDMAQRIRNAVGGAYFTSRRNDAGYQEAFQNAGREKAQSVLQKFSTIPNERQRRYAYVSIGGADGSEIAWAMNNSPISRGVMIEFGTEAAAIARKRIPKLNEVQKALVVIEGDATQKLDEVIACLDEWKQSIGIDGIVVSAQSVLHELPHRSPGYKPNVFFGKLFKGWDNILVCCREPCAPQQWPEIVEIKLKGVDAEALAAMAQYIKDRLVFNGDVYAMPDDFVHMPANLAVETLFKVLYLDDTFAYEMGERLTAFDPKRLVEFFTRFLDANSVQVDYTVSGRFSREYQNLVHSVYDANTSAILGMPNCFARITAEKRRS